MRNHMRAVYMDRVWSHGVGKCETRPGYEVRVQRKFWSDYQGIARIFVPYDATFWQRYGVIRQIIKAAQQLASVSEFYGVMREGHNVCLRTVLL